MRGLIVLALIGVFGCGAIREDVRGSIATSQTVPDKREEALSSTDQAAPSFVAGWKERPPTTDELRLLGDWDNGHLMDLRRTSRTIEFGPDGMGKSACRTQSDQWEGAWRLSDASDANGWRKLTIGGKEVAEIRLRDEGKLSLRRVGEADAEVASALPEGIWNNDDPAATLERDEAAAKEVTFVRYRKWSGGLTSGLPDGVWIKEDYVGGQRVDQFVRFVAGVRQE